MAWVDDLEDLMTETIMYAGWLGLSTDGYAVPTFSTDAASYPARVTNEQRLVRTFDGTEELATTTVWVASTSTFAATGQFTLPTGEAPPLLNIETYRDENGVTHSKLGFGQ